MFDTLWSICSIGGLLLTFQNCFVVVQSAQMRLVFPGFKKWPFIGSLLFTINLKEISAAFVLYIIESVSNFQCCDRTGSGQARQDIALALSTGRQAELDQSSTGSITDSDTTPTLPSANRAHLTSDSLSDTKLPAPEG